jgi:peroxiredoxin
MKKQSKYRRKIIKTQRQYLAIGVFLVLVGIVLFVVLQGNGAKMATSTTDFSVVPAVVNYPAPQLALENVNGETESLADFSGQVLLLNNWATWCPPCKAEMPTLKKFHDAHSAEGFTIIAVEAGDGKEEVLQFANSLGLTFPIWLDPDGAALNAFKNGNLPNSYVIDRTGTVRYAWTGEVSLAMLEKYIAPLITESN